MNRQEIAWQAFVFGLFISGEIAFGVYATFADSWGWWVLIAPFVFMQWIGVANLISELEP